MTLELKDKLIESMQKWVDETYPTRIKENVSYSTGNDGVIGVETKWLCMSNIQTVGDFKKFTEMSKKAIDEIIALPNLQGYEVFKVAARCILHSTENPDGELMFFRILAAKKEQLEKVA